ncbi:MAG: hypothetical protein A3I44_02245 [Candidatus Sungbacteria bacterium RIFCSPLOWO2_02_FULL_51_17]|uniref:ribose-phosphate diphosphokinase n=1 Tax=Candidatus Sungbacteria bacterium RIFCSPHIGHO2_02_FULL_51_29 TaxID=1802273 RepID=A0A1G2KXI9_9BACT|nr:MAG: hypothetical protein A2676_01920 [Candidatus Sungbacteria bacterium RIFCSPHIGHO2_01_FULL_51_22]OHA04100.1 MAG: hypothetical protein A3C16_02120 [Candidatus Sungbacteria bacterium RIFCSPHIGHO2_02_FULL_51_29]OHA04752.1 MAG: hypothetical protein A3B29_01440 [Candidatus Sungbacteria bacterium RIFCSPLOWO2_01_FULL_51_34]OHA12014.1 MAG: hypothetical protein A3I44_02245 [Candidatus Sungbacteria bacterium RIFCSPLOWO2_02_FULL_51_17]
MPDLKIFAGRASEKLAADIAAYIEAADPSWKSGRTKPVLGKVERKNFADGEQYDRPLENVRGDDVFIIQSTVQPDSNFLNLLFLVSTMKFASAARVTAVIPYFGYSRQDRKDKSRAPVNILPLIDALRGVDRVMLLDVHSTPTPDGFMLAGVKVDHLYARPIFLKYLRAKKDELWGSSRGLLLAAPDANAEGLARAYKRALGAQGHILITKERSVEDGKASVITVIGDPKGYDILIVDDMIDSGKTNCNAVDELKARGAERIRSLATHAVLSGNAVERIQQSGLEEVIVTDSIHHSALGTAPPSKITVLSAAHLLGEAILRTHNNASVSSLFDED